MRTYITVPKSEESNVSNELSNKNYKFTIDRDLEFRGELIYTVFFEYKNTLQANIDTISIEKKYNPKIYA